MCTTPCEMPKCLKLFLRQKGEKRCKTMESGILKDFCTVIYQAFIGPGMIACLNGGCPRTLLRAGLCQKHINTTRWVLHCVLTISDKPYLAVRGTQILTYTDVMFYCLVKNLGVGRYSFTIKRTQFGGLICYITKTDGDAE